MKAPMSLPLRTVVLKAAAIGALAFACTSSAYAADLKSRVTAQGLAPHKALYEIKLVSTHSGSQILNISGQMFYEWESSCDAWISNHRFNMLYEYADTAPMRVSSDFSTHEPFDGLSFNFTSQRKRDGELFEELRGQALIKPEGAGAGHADYSIPPELAFDLPAGTLFPMGHTMNVAEKIKEGKKFYKATIFDGSDDAGPVEVNAFIGKPVEQPNLQQVEGSGMIDQKLIQSPARSVRLAFFPVNTPEATSDYEMTMVLHENGVISDMTIEYDDFSVSQKLIALEEMPDTCNASKFNP